MNTQQEYEYFDGNGQICQGNEEFLGPITKSWSSTGCKKGEALGGSMKYRRPIGIFTKEYQAELAKQWVLEGGFDRERWNVNHWQESGINTWTNGVIYRRKPQPSQEELDTQAAKEYSKTATIQTDTTVIEKAYMEGMKHERNRNK